MNKFDSRRTWGPAPAYPKVLEYPRQPEHSPLIVLAGPCSVESEEQIRQVVSELALAGPTFARGGVFRAGTYPRPNYGLKRALARSWARSVRKAGLRTIMEVLDIRDIDWMDQYADAFQVGARHCQDYGLLKELSKAGKVVTLKRNMGMTLDEFLGAAEYLAQGRCTPILIERGSATHMNHVRWDLSLSLIAAVKRITGLPILVDASHGTGRHDLVMPMTMAGIAAGADGFLVEVHPDPARSLSDSDQALHVGELNEIMRRAVAVRNAARGWLE